MSCHCRAAGWPAGGGSAREIEIRERRAGGVDRQPSIGGAEAEVLTPDTGVLHPDLFVQPPQHREGLRELRGGGVLAAVEDDPVRARVEIREVVAGQRPIEPVVGVQVIELRRRGAAAVTLGAGIGQEVRLDRVAASPARLIAAVEGRVQAVGAPAARRGILEDEPEQRVAAGLHRLRHQDDLIVGGTPRWHSAARLERIAPDLDPRLEHVEEQVGGGDAAGGRRRVRRNRQPDQFAPPEILRGGRPADPGHIADLRGEETRGQQPVGIAGHQVARGMRLQVLPRHRLEPAESQEVVERTLDRKTELLLDVAGIVGGRLRVPLIHQQAQVLAAVRRSSHGLQGRRRLESRRRRGLPAGRSHGQCRAHRRGDSHAGAPGQHGNVRSFTPNAPISRRSLPTSRSNVR